MAGIVVSVNVSPEKGTIKKPVGRIRVTSRGIENDGHAGAWHRQVSLLARESADRLSRECGRVFSPGEFAENLTTAALDLSQVGLRDRLVIGQVELEVTQIGKECHGAGCAVFQTTGKCIMPTEGIFSRVLVGGEIRPGDSIEHVSRPLRILIVTLSDRASRGDYEDKSGPALEEGLRAHFAGSRWRLQVETTLLPDDAGRLRRRLQEAVESRADVVFTTGGTGIGPGDITPDTVRPMLDREIPGIMDFVRIKYGQSAPSALLSRSVAGVIGRSLVFVLPGSVKAVKEYLGEILRMLEHAVLSKDGIEIH